MVERYTSLNFFTVFFISCLTMAPACNFSSHAGPITHPPLLVSFLEKLQASALETFGPSHFDPKPYVDLPLKFDLGQTITAFEKLPRLANGSISVHDLKGFLDKNLGRAGGDLVYVEPVDFVAEPEGFLPGVRNPEVRRWALEVHSLWKNLSRKVSEEVQERPALHTLLPLMEPVIVPGSRFTEIYYWDSYWVIRGLLVSKMYDTAKAIVNNLISLIDTYGFVPNGARVYYSNRSQPPLLSSMVMDIYTRTGDLELVQRSFSSLLNEHKFWNSGLELSEPFDMRFYEANDFVCLEEIHKVTIQDTEGRNHSLSRYYAMWNKPRPESSTIDKVSASKLSNKSEKERFYRELATTAESGWDFSSRWMSDPHDLTTLRTTLIVPVDLNAYILKMELDIAFFARILGENSIAKSFAAASEARRAAMGTIFWNAEMGQWLDYWLVGNGTCKESHKWKAHNQNHNIFASNIIPVWIKALNTGGTVEKVMESLQSSGLIYSAGISTSLSNSGQQWDFPNGWAPLQHLIIEGLARSGSKEARSMAEDIAVRWIRTNYAAFKKTGYMHEKYDVRACGKVGDGGEYTPQTGFGWSNGVVLAFLEEFGWSVDREIDCDDLANCKICCI